MGMDLVIGLLVKPFVAFVVLFFVVLLAGLIYKLMPEGRLKRILFSPLPGQKRRWR